MPGALGIGEWGYCLMEFQFGKMRKFWKWMVAYTTLRIYLMPLFCIFLDPLFVYLASVHPRANYINYVSLFSLLWDFQVAQNGCTKESTSQCRRHTRYRFNPWVREILWSRKWQLTLVHLPGTFHGQRKLAGSSPRCHRVRHDWAHTHDALVFVEKPPRPGQFLKIT